MDALRNSIKVTKQIFTPIRLNIIFLLVNILVGIAIKNTPLIVSSCIAFVCVVALSLRNPMKERIHRLSDQIVKPQASLPAGSNERIVRLSDQIVVASVMIAIFVLWFDTHHHIRSLSGLILLYAFGIFLIGKLNALYNSENKDTKGIRKWIYDALHYFGSFGHFLFNLEYALLVLI
jgi:flagellar biogenesis protein FliO